jgi:hypothetical protein
MTGRLLVVAALAAAPGAARAEGVGRGFDAPNLTWAATHIVLVEGEKVVESWAGDLKPGDELPDGAAAYARIRPPRLDPDWVKASGRKPPVLPGKPMVLFLAYVPDETEEDKRRVWMGAECPGFPSHPPSARNVAWVEGDRVYVLGGMNHEWLEGLGSPGTLAGLREQVGLGRALRARFDAAKAEPDPAKRADRLAALAPAVVTYAGLWGKYDAFDPVAGCGAAGVPHLVRWATDPEGKARHEARSALCRTGDAGVGAVLTVLDGQVRYWTGAADRLKPGQAAGDLSGNPQNPWAGNGLYHLLVGVRAMRLSADNQKRVREHPGLAELDRLLEARPELKAGLVRMDDAHRRLRDIRAGRFRPAD